MDNQNIKIAELTHNIALSKAGLYVFGWIIMLGSTFVLRKNFNPKNPRHRQYPNL
jgi:hypothetical protein